MLVPLTETIDKTLNLAITLTASQVEDVAQLYHFSKDNNIAYSDFGFPSIRDGGIDKVIKSIGYTNYYDPDMDSRIFLFNNSDTNGCYFKYSDKTGSTFVQGNCGVSGDLKDKLVDSFEIEKLEEI
jgi:hypothetical protein